jgi:mRNA interferase MazF
VASRLRVSRSQLYFRAIEQYLDKRKDALVTEPSNAVYAANQGAVDPALPPPSPRYSLMKRGDIWRARLAGPIGSGPGHRRPVVVQCNPFNDSRIATEVVATITSNLALAEAPGNVRIAKSDSGLFTATRRQCLARDYARRFGPVSRGKSLPGAVVDKTASGLKLALARS